MRLRVKTLKNTLRPNNDHNFAFNIFFFSRTTRSISTKLNTKHYWVKGIQVCTNEEPRLVPRGDNYEIAKYTDEINKSSSQEPLGQFQTNLAQSILG